MTETETETKKLEPTFQVEEVGPCKLLVRAEVAVDKIRERIEGKYRDLNDQVALPGFRRGHAPRPILERKFGKALLDDLKMELLNDSFEEVRELRNLEPVSMPDIDPATLTLNEGQPFKYEVTIEVRPKVELKPYTGLKVKRPKVEVKPEDVDRVLKDLRETRAELVPVTEPAAEGNQVICDVVILADGKELEKAENAAFFIQKDLSFYGLPMPELSGRLTGRKPGDTVEQELEIPADFRIKAWGGKKALLRATLKGVKSKVVPELDEAFAKSFDADTLDELRELVQKRVRREREEAARQHMAEHLVGQILEANPFPLPQGLVDSGTEEALQRMQVNLMMQGQSEEEVQKHLPELAGESREGMAQTLKRHFVMDQIAKNEKIFVTEDQIQERISRMAAEYGRWPHEMKAELEQRGLLSQLRRQMREDLVLAWLLEKAVIEDEASGKS